MNDLDLISKNNTSRVSYTEQTYSWKTDNTKDITWRTITATSPAEAARKATLIYNLLNNYVLFHSKYIYLLIKDAKNIIQLFMCTCTVESKVESFYQETLIKKTGSKKEVI